MSEHEIISELQQVRIELIERQKELFMVRNKMNGLFTSHKVMLDDNLLHYFEDVEQSIHTSVRCLSNFIEAITESECEPGYVTPTF